MSMEQITIKVTNLGELKGYIKDLETAVKNIEGFKLKIEVKP